MRIATYNVQNLFMRPRALRPSEQEKDREVLEAFTALNVTLQKPRYNAADRARILKKLEVLGILHKDDGGSYAVLRNNHGHLLSRHKDGTVEVVATGRADWQGWVELKTEALSEASTRNLARVLGFVGADVQAFIEVEGRLALQQFSDGVMAKVKGGAPYDHVMSIKGCDKRGIDVGIATQHGYALETMRSHVDDRAEDGGRVFSRDCPEYEVVSPGGTRVLVLVNHFKSRANGTKAECDARRLEQTRRVAEIYQQRRAEGWDNIVVLGDFNGTLDDTTVAPLLATDLRNAKHHQGFDDGGFPGTYAGCGTDDDIDHILLSPALDDAMTGGGIYRKYAWRTSAAWEDAVDAQVDAASDHCAVYADLAIA